MHIRKQHWVETQEQVWKDSVERHGLSNSVLYTREFMIQKNLAGGETLKGYRKHLIVHHRFLHLLLLPVSSESTYIQDCVP